VPIRLVGLQRSAKVPLRDLNAADPPVADSESILPSGIAGVGFRQKVDNRESIEEGFERAGKVAAFLLDIAEAGERPTFVKRLIAGPRKFGYALKPLLRVGKIATIDENSARPIQTRDIVRIKRDSLLISLQRALRIGKASDRAEMAVGGGLLCVGAARGFLFHRFGFK